MIEIQNNNPLVSRIDEMLTAIEDHKLFYQHNEEILDIYEGNLLPYVEKLMEETLDARYFKLIKHRITPINFTQKITDKLAKSYADEPLRKCDNQDFVDDYVKMLDLDSKMMLAEELYSGGERNANSIRRHMTELIERELLAQIDYISVANAETLKELDRIDNKALVSMAVIFGKTRLIDNIVVGV